MRSQREKSVRKTIDMDDVDATLALTNLEMRRMFYVMVGEWFQQSYANYNDFIKALLLRDLKAMNIYMNKVELETFSYFET